MEVEFGTLLILLSLASKVCENKEAIRATFDDPMNLAQFDVLVDRVEPVLAMADENYPGLLPLSHDGVPWRKRVE